MGVRLTHTLWLVVSSWIRYQRKNLTTDGGRCGNIRPATCCMFLLTILGLKLCTARQVVVLLTTTLLVWNSYAFVDVASRRLMVRETQIPFPSPKKPSSSYQSTGLHGSSTFPQLESTGPTTKGNVMSATVEYFFASGVWKACESGRSSPTTLRGKSWTVGFSTVKKFKI